jgi:hypothetical protein
MTYRRTTLLLAIALAACQSSEPARMGKDRYMLSGTGAWGGWSSGTAIKSELYRQATEFCQRQGKQMVPGPAVSNDIGFDDIARAEVQFQCLPE